MAKKIKESIEEFIARGGIIQKIDPAPLKEQLRPSINIITGGGPAVIMTYSDANLYYGEIRHRKPRKSTAKPIAPIDFNVLPEAIRNKYLKGVLDDME